MPHNYSPENLKNSIDSIEKLLELHNKQDIKMHELLWSLTRIQRGMNKEFWLPKALEETKKEAKIELDKQHPTFEYGTSSVVNRAKKKLMDKEKSFYNSVDRKIPWDYGHPTHMFQDFEFFMQKQWEGDRKRLIDQGEIKEEIKEIKN